MEASTPLDYIRTLLVTRCRLSDAALMEWTPGESHHRHTLPLAKLILVVEGTIHYTVNGVTLTLRPGMVLYRPPQSAAEWWVPADDAGGCRMAYAEYEPDRPRDTFRKPVWVTSADLDLERASFARLRDLLYQPGPTAALIAEAELKAVLGRFFGRATEPVVTAVRSAPLRLRGGAGEAAARAAQSYLNQHLTDPAALTSLHARVGLSEDHFRLVFRRVTGMSAQRYLMHVRLVTARSYLERSSLTVKEIARLVGYRDPLYFSKLFHRRFGRTPTQQRHRKAP